MLAKTRMNNMKKPKLKTKVIILLSSLISLSIGQSAIAGESPPPPPEPVTVPESNTTNTLLTLGALGLGLAFKQKLDSVKNKRKS